MKESYDSAAACEEARTVVEGEMGSGEDRIARVGGRAWWMGRGRDVGEDEGGGVGVVEWSRWVGRGRGGRGGREDT